MQWLRSAISGITNTMIGKKILLLRPYRRTRLTTASVTGTYDPETKLATDSGNVTFHRDSIPLGR